MKSIFVKIILFVLLASPCFAIELIDPLPKAERHLRDRLIMAKTIEKIDGILDEGADIDWQNEKGETALIKAVKRRLVNVAKYILDSNANPDLRDMRGQTALFLAVKYEYSEIAKLLIEYGADVQTEDYDNKTALMIAKEKNLMEFIKLLEENGAY